VAAESSRTELANLDAEIRRLVLDRRRLERSPDAEAEAELAEVENRLDAAREASQTISQTAALEADRVSLSSPAFAPGAPARPKPALYLLVAVLFALALATVAALLRNTFDERVRDDDELSELLGAPIVAQIPESRDVDSRRDGLFREAFNFLNANVHVGDPGRALRTVAITSPVPEVGKTTVVRELSRSLTSGRRRVVAVEADLRKPKLTKYMAMRNGRSGLASLLTQGGDPRPLLQWADHGLALLPPGRPLPPDPAGLFDPDRFEDVLERLSQQADYVLVDTAPVLAAPETSTITALVDRVLIVVTPGASRRRTLTATRNQLQQSGANVVGIVVNRIPRREQQYEYYYSPLAVLDGGDPEAEPSPTSSPSPHRTNP
jgi:capsular exopolysaccharide synthesis family protein